MPIMLKDFGFHLILKQRNRMIEPKKKEHSMQRPYLINEIIWNFTKR